MVLSTQEVLPLKLGVCDLLIFGWPMALEVPTKLNQLDVLVLCRFFLSNLSFAFALRLTP